MSFSTIERAFFQHRCKLQDFYQRFIMLFVNFFMHTQLLLISTQFLHGCPALLLFSLNSHLPSQTFFRRFSTPLSFTSFYVSRESFFFLFTVVIILLSKIVRYDYFSANFLSTFADFSSLNWMLSLQLYYFYKKCNLLNNKLCCLPFVFFSNASPLKLTHISTTISSF